MDQETMPSSITPVPWWLLVSWVVTIAGWIIVDRRAVRHNSASEVFQMINDLENLLNDFRFNVTESLQLDGNCPEAGRLRRQAIEMTKIIQSKLAILRQRSEEFNFNSQYIELKKLATGRDFESTKRPAFSLEDEHLDNIEKETRYLILKIHESYTQTYRRSILRKIRKDPATEK